MLSDKLMREACALLVLDETATPVGTHTLEEGYDGRFVPCDLDAKEAVVNARLILAQAIRSMTEDEAREILEANCVQVPTGSPEPPLSPIHQS